MQDSSKLLFESNCDSLDLNDILESLLQLIKFMQKQPVNSKARFSSLLLWVSEVNGYVSAHWFDENELIADEDSGYAVLSLTEFHDSLIKNENITFFSHIIELLKKLKTEKRIRESLRLWHTDELYDPELL